MKGKVVSYLSYQQGKACYAGVFGKDYSYGVYINPYTGQIQHVSDFKNGLDFFDFVLDGHR